MKTKPEISRRGFLKASFIGVFGYGVLASAGLAWSRQNKGMTKIKDYRILGRTGFKVSDLAVGYVNDEGVMASMLDRGMNYIDTGESYPGAHPPLVRAKTGLKWM